MNHFLFFSVTAVTVNHFHTSILTFQAAVIVQEKGSCYMLHPSKHFFQLSQKPLSSLRKLSQHTFCNCRSSCQILFLLKLSSGRLKRSAVAFPIQHSPFVSYKDGIIKLQFVVMGINDLGTCGGTLISNRPINIYSKYPHGRVPPHHF